MINISNLLTELEVTLLNSVMHTLKYPASLLLSIFLLLYVLRTMRTYKYDNFSLPDFLASLAIFGALYNFILPTSIYSRLRDSSMPGYVLDKSAKLAEHTLATDLYFLMDFLVENLSKNKFSGQSEDLKLVEASPDALAMANYYRHTSAAVVLINALCDQEGHVSQLDKDMCVAKRTNEVFVSKENGKYIIAGHQVSALRAEWQDKLDCSPLSPLQCLEKTIGYPLAFYSLPSVLLQGLYVMLDVVNLITFLCILVFYKIIGIFYLFILILFCSFILLEKTRPTFFNILQNFMQVMFVPLFVRLLLNLFDNAQVQIYSANLFTEATLQQAFINQAFSFALYFSQLLIMWKIRNFTSLISINHQALASDISTTSRTALTNTSNFAIKKFSEFRNKGEKDE